MKKIMVVDNEPDIVDLTRTVLEIGGYSVVPAYSGEECLRRLDKEHVDLVLLDIMMPGMSGCHSAAIDIDCGIRGRDGVLHQSNSSRGSGKVLARDSRVKQSEKPNSPVLTRFQPCRSTSRFSGTCISRTMSTRFAGRR